MAYVTLRSTCRMGGMRFVNCSVRQPSFLISRVPPPTRHSPKQPFTFAILLQVLSAFSQPFQLVCTQGTQRTLVHPSYTPRYWPFQARKALKALKLQTALLAIPARQVHPQV